MEDKSILDIIGKAKQVFKDNWNNILSIIFLMIFSLFLTGLFPFLGITISVFSSSFISIGLTFYMLSIFRNESQPIETLFSKFKNCISAFSLFVVRTFYILFWSLLLVIPGVICLLNYSFACIIMSENENIDAFSALQRSKKIAYGYRTNILFIYLYFVLLALLTYGISLLFPFVLSMFIYLSIYDILLISLIITAVISVFIYLPLLQLSLISLYEEIKFYENEDKSQLVKYKNSKKSLSKSNKKSHSSKKKRT